MAPSSGSNLTQCYITLAVRQKPQSPHAPSEHSEHNRKADRQTERQRIAYTRIKFHQNDSPFCVLVLSNFLPHFKIFTTLSFCFLSCNKTVHRTSKSIKKKQHFFHNCTTRLLGTLQFSNLANPRPSGLTTTQDQQLQNLLGLRQVKKVGVQVMVS